MFNKFLSLYDANALLCITQLPINNKPIVTYKKAAEIDAADYLEKENVFFTPNAMGYRYDNESKRSTIKRDREHLHTLECLYVDIDIKDAADDLSGITPESIVAHMRLHNFRTEVPEPTMVSCSGNGIHLYWKIHSVSFQKNIEKWEAVQQYIYEVFRSYGADHKVTTDKVRVLRVPGTCNVKEHSTTQCYTMSYTGAVYDLDTLIDDFDIKQTKIISFNENKSNKKAEYHGEGRVVSFYTALYNRRIADLEQLLYMRDAQGSRENILFLMRYYLLEVGFSAEEALKKIIAINSNLAHPLPLREVVCATKSAEKYHAKNKLKWKNEKIIEFLGIDENEMKNMKCLISAAEKKERKQKKNKEYYAQQLCAAGRSAKADTIKMRRYTIYDLLQCGRSAREICAELDISKSTYYRELAAIKDDTFKAEYEEYCAENQRLASTGTDGQPVTSTSNIADNSAVSCNSQKFSSRNYVSLGSGGNLVDSLYFCSSFALVNTS